MFEGFFQVVGHVLSFFYSIIPSVGVAIILLTLLAMLLLTPLTVKSTKGMLEMQLLAPELKKLQKQYKDDKTKLNEEMMKLYQEHGVNPLGGCLPMLGQIPVFLIMYRIVKGLTNRDEGVGAGVGHIVGQLGAKVSPTPWLLTDQPFQPQHISTTSELYKDLHGATKMPFSGIKLPVLDMDLSLSALDAWGKGIGTFIPYFALILFILVTGIVQQRQIQGRNSNAQVNQMQQTMMKIMPIFLPVFSFNFPAALTIYWSTQQIVRIGQQSYITKRFYSGDHTLGAKAKKAQDEAKLIEPGKSVKSQALAAKNEKTAKKPEKPSGGTVKKTSSSTTATPGTRRRSGQPKTNKQRKK